MVLSNKSVNFLKSKVVKKFSSSKSPGSTVSSSLYSGVASAERAIQKPGSLFSIHSNHLRGLNDQLVPFTFGNFVPSIQYHPWESKFDQILTREKIKKCMTKNPYTPQLHSTIHANVSITTEEECHPVLLLPNSIHIEKLIIQETKSFLPNITRNNVKSSERLASQIPVRKSSNSSLEIERKTPLPIISNNKNNDITLNLKTTDRLLNRAKIRNNRYNVRRPPPRKTKTFMETMHDNMTSLAVYG